MTKTCAPASSDVTLLTEHLTYRPTALIDDIINSINILAFKATEAVERGLLAADPSDLGFKIPPQNTPEGLEAAQKISEKAKNEIENGVHQLETLLEAKIDKNFDRLEIYALRNILNVPEKIRDWVRLKHYEGLNFDFNHDLPNTESICLQRKKLREAQKLNTWLRAESAKNKATIMSIQSLITNKEIKHELDESSKEVYPAFKFLNNKGELTGDVSRPVTTSASFALSQLPVLEGFLDNLKPRIKRLADTLDAEDLVKKEGIDSNRERLEFIETETRRHLQIVRGLELGKQGEVIDGEWQGSGRNIQKEELMDLENFVQTIVSSTGESKT